MDRALIIVRALHFAATALAIGAILFMVLIAEPAFREQGGLARLQRGIVQFASANLAVALISGAAWLVIFVGEMGRQMPDVPLGEIAWTVITETRFGYTSIARLLLAALLAGYLVRGRFTWVAAALAAGFAGALAWSGHAGAAPGLRGDLHVLADALHLIAAAAWLGGLVPLAAVLGHVRKAKDDWPSIDAVTVVTHRFSNLGLASVGTLFATGAVNTWSVAAGAAELIQTAYGQLLLVKIALFLVMVCIAAINRQILTPRISQSDAMRRLQRNTVAEIGLGLIILALVGALGTMSPTAPVHAH